MTDATPRTTTPAPAPGTPTTNPDDALREAREPLKQHGDALLEGTSQHAKSHPTEPTRPRGD